MNISAENSIISINKPMIVGRVTILVFQARTPTNRPCLESIAFYCLLVHKETDKKCAVEVKKANQNNYTLTLRPSLRGRHELRVRINDQTIKTLPLSVAPDPASLGTPTRVIKGLDGPWGVTINSREQFIVTEWSGCQVVIFNRDWTKIRSFGIRGTGNGQFKQPIGVAVDSKDNIYIVDWNNHRIQKFSPEGVFLSLVGTEGSDNLQFNYPIGIAYNKENGWLYICDQRNNRVQVLTTELTFHSCFGQEGSGDGEFINPSGVCCDYSGTVFVADSDNHRVQVFTAEGQFVRKFGCHGDGPGQLNGPIGVVAGAGVVYVCELLGYRVSMFTITGQFINSFGSRGSSDGQFHSPTDVVIDNEQNVSVVDSNMYRLQIF